MEEAVQMWTITAATVAKIKAADIQVIYIHTYIYNIFLHIIYTYICMWCLTEL